MGDMIRCAGMPTGIIKHFCPPVPDVAHANNMTASVVASKDAILRALRGSHPFFMETDYIDDLSRPGAVLGPKTVPRRTKALSEAGLMSHEACVQTHVDLPERIYGIDMHSGHCTKP
jgi:TatD-related deoxyribonuclease